MNYHKKLREINDQAALWARNIKILGPLTWAKHTEQEFLDSWHRRQLKLPKIEYRPIDHSQEIEGLNGLLKGLSTEDPLGRYTHDTIASFVHAARMVQAAGTEDFQKYSIEIYGSPGDKIPGSNQTNLEMAIKLAGISQKFARPNADEPKECLTAHYVTDFLAAQIRKSFGDNGPKIVINNNIAAKATASMSVINLHPGTCFNKYDPYQLYIHEVMTHSLTAINGDHQQILTLMSRGAPRTTKTQEGLATFSEVITGAIDINRLSRIALRILAIDKALQGADFVEIFKYFLDNGQTDKESFWSAARIFRGGYPDRSIVFTKDAVYLDGLVKVHTLFRWAMMNQRLDLLQLLFCGRLDIEDVFLLEEPYKKGLIIPPQYVPPWYERIEGLAGILSFDLVTSIFVESEIEAYFSAHDKAP